MNMLLQLCIIAILCFHFALPANAGTLSDAQKQHMIDSNSDVSTYNYKITPAPPGYSPSIGDVNEGVGTNNYNSGDNLNARQTVRCLTSIGSCSVEDEERAAYLEGARCYCQFDRNREPSMGAIIIIK